MSSPEIANVISHLANGGTFFNRMYWQNKSILKFFLSWPSALSLENCYWLMSSEASTVMNSAGLLENFPLKKLKIVWSANPRPSSTLSIPSAQLIFE
jgi:hypothetical protein